MFSKKIPAGFPAGIFFVSNYTGGKKKPDDLSTHRANPIQVEVLYLECVCAFFVLQNCGIFRKETVVVFSMVVFNHGMTG